MLKLKNLEPAVWKDNVTRKSHAKWRLTSKLLTEKYMRKQQDNVFSSLEGRKRERFLGVNRVQQGYNEGSGCRFDSWQCQPRDNTGRHREMPHRVNSGHTIGLARASN
jgi:hypothetical protein